MLVDHKIYERELKRKIRASVKKIAKDETARSKVFGTKEKHNRRTLTRSSRILDEYKYDQLCKFDGVVQDTTGISDLVPLDKGHFIHRDATVSFLSVFHQPKVKPEAEDDDFDVIDRFDTFGVVPEAGYLDVEPTNSPESRYTREIRVFKSTSANKCDAKMHYQFVHWHNGYRKAKTSINNKYWLYDPETNVRTLKMLNCTRTLSKTKDFSGDLNTNDIQLLSELNACDGAIDCYMAMNEFSGLRSSSNIAAFTAIYFDIDNVEKRFGLSKDEFVALLLGYCDEKGVTQPTFISDSGNGLHIVYLFKEPVGNKAEKKWAKLWDYMSEFLIGFAKAHNLVDKLAKDGKKLFVADGAARDPARILRIWGSVNSKTGTVCRPIWISGGLESPNKVSFEHLCDEFMPMTNQQYTEMKLKEIEQRISAKAEEFQELKTRILEKEGSLDVRNGYKRKAFNAAEYYQVILNDLIKLDRNGDIGPGLWDFWLFHVTVCLGYVKSVDQLISEVKKMAKIHDWKEPEALSYMSSAIKRAVTAARFKRENGKSWFSVEEDPRYKLKAQKLINIYGLTEDTIRELDLRGIITREIKQERNTAYIQNKRRSNPEVQERLKKALELSKKRHARNREILKHLSTGNSIKQTAIDFGLSRQAIYNVLNAIKNTVGKVCSGTRSSNRDSYLQDYSAHDFRCKVACHYL